MLRNHKDAIRMMADPGECCKYLACINVRYQYILSVSMNTLNPIVSDSALLPTPGAADIPVGTKTHKEWFSRGYLPHCDHPGLVQSISFRLHDSVPSEVLAQWRIELRELEMAIGTDTAVEQERKRAALRRRVEKYEDSGYGSCCLKDRRVAQIMQDALLFFDGKRYQLLAWCVMPNHVHVAVETIIGWPLPGLLHSWRSFAANEANKVLGRKGTFWMREYFDRFIRDQRHLEAVISYIEQNPVKAGLVERAEEWTFSSAGRRRAVGMTADPGGDRPSR
jgi:REP element-mobilizing transposase RayT